MFDYMIVDLGVKYVIKIGGVNIIFRVNVNNLIDEKYWEGVFNFYYVMVGGVCIYKFGVIFDF